MLASYLLKREISTRLTEASSKQSGEAILEYPPKKLGWGPLTSSL